MDKGSNEAERGEVARERRGGQGESNVEGRGRKQAAGRREERRVRCRVERWKQREGSRGMCLTASFSHASSVLVRLTEAAQERWKRMRDRGRKSRRC